MCCREQEKREERQRLKEQGVVLEDDPDGVGSFDDGDPHTTNLYIGGYLLTSILTQSAALPVPESPSSYPARTGHSGMLHTGPNQICVTGPANIAQIAGRLTLDGALPHT